MCVCVWCGVCACECVCVCVSVLCTCAHVLFPFLPALAKVVDDYILGKGTQVDR